MEAARSNMSSKCVREDEHFGKRKFNAFFPPDCRCRSGMCTKAGVERKIKRKFARLAFSIWFGNRQGSAVSINYQPEAFIIRAIEHGVDCEVYSTNTADDHNLGGRTKSNAILNATSPAVGASY